HRGRQRRLEGVRQGERRRPGQGVGGRQLPGRVPRGEGRPVGPRRRLRRGAAGGPRGPREEIRGRVPVPLADRTALVRRFGVAPGVQRHPAGGSDAREEHRKHAVV
ncbi:MAG: hypothetical protein AVDCRST_MAG05-721, partial [uncultured Rubrobacteraceae bacterium]